MNQKERMLKELPYKAWLDGLPKKIVSIIIKIMSLMLIIIYYNKFRKGVTLC